MNWLTTSTGSPRSDAETSPSRLGKMRSSWIFRAIAQAVGVVLPADPDQ